jgi:hypothetical protein
MNIEMEDVLAAPATGSFFCHYPDCGQRDHGYTRKKALQDHIRSKHTNIRFPCPYNGCATDFARADDLRKHVRNIHDGEKPFVCDEASGCNCNKRFATRNTLNRHVAVWTAANTQNTQNTELGTPVEDAESTDILLRNTSELPDDPELLEAFKNALYQAINELDGGVFSMLEELVSIALLSASRLSVEFSVRTDDRESKIYTILVNAFRRRRPKSCAWLIEKIVNYCIVDLEEQPDQQKSSVDSRSDVQYSNAVTSPQGVAITELESLRVGILSRRDNLKTVFGKTIKDAANAARYCRSIASGHTESSYESVTEPRSGARDDLERYRRTFDIPRRDFGDPTPRHRPPFRSESRYRQQDQLLVEYGRQF